MAKFDYAAFSYEPGSGCCSDFVVNAKKYTKNEVVDLYNQQEFNTRPATLEDIKETYCVYRLNIADFEGGVYTFANKGDRGAFPVFVVNIEEMRCENKMTKESLQKKCNESGLKVKILFVEKTEFDDYEVVYTFDMNYPGRDSYEQILEPELDELVKDEKEFIFMVNLRGDNNADRE